MMFTACGDHAGQQEVNFMDLSVTGAHLCSECHRFHVPVERPVWVGLRGSLSARWWTFHQAHPEVYVHLVCLARAATDRGVQRLGIAMLWETLRYETMLGAVPGEDAFRLNNSHRAYYSRYIMEMCPDLAGVFQTRKAAA